MTRLLMELLVMTRSALVTGGTRGIGQPAACYSRVPGYKVVAVYHGNDQVAERFKRDTGIPVVTVNAICPGYIATGMVRAMPVEVVEKKILPLILVGRLGEAEEVARAVRLFLASDDAGFIMGSTMTVNGGQHM